MSRTNNNIKSIQPNRSTTTLNDTNNSNPNPVFTSIFQQWFRDSQQELKSYDQELTMYQQWSNALNSRYEKFAPWAQECYTRSTQSECALAGTSQAAQPIRPRLQGSAIRCSWRTYWFSKSTCMADESQWKDAIHLIKHWSPDDEPLLLPFTGYIVDIVYRITQGNLKNASGLHRTGERADIDALNFYFFYRLLQVSEQQDLVGVIPIVALLETRADVVSQLLSLNTHGRVSFQRRLKNIDLWFEPIVIRSPEQQPPTNGQRIRTQPSTRQQPKKKSPFTWNWSSTRWGLVMLPILLSAQIPLVATTQLTQTSTAFTPIPPTTSSNTPTLAIPQTLLDLALQNTMIRAPETKGMGGVNSLVVVPSNITRFRVEERKQFVEGLVAEWIEAKDRHFTLEKTFGDFGKEVTSLFPLKQGSAGLEGIRNLVNHGPLLAYFVSIIALYVQQQRLVDLWIQVYPEAIEGVKSFQVELRALKQQLEIKNAQVLADPSVYEAFVHVNMASYNPNFQWDYRSHKDIVVEHLRRALNIQLKKYQGENNGKHVAEVISAAIHLELSLISAQNLNATLEKAKSGIDANILPFVRIFPLEHTKMVQKSLNTAYDLDITRDELADTMEQYNTQMSQTLLEDSLRNLRDRTLELERNLTQQQMNQQLSEQRSNLTRELYELSEAVRKTSISEQPILNIATTILSRSTLFVAALVVLVTTIKIQFPTMGRSSTVPVAPSTVGSNNNRQLWEQAKELFYSQLQIPRAYKSDDLKSIAKTIKLSLPSNALKGQYARAIADTIYEGRVLQSTKSLLPESIQNEIDRAYDLYSRMKA